MIHSIKTYFVFIFAIVLIKDSIVCLPFGGTWRQVGTDIDGKAAFDRFGKSVAMSADGKTIVVGAPYSSDTNRKFAGQVRVYSMNTTIGNWQQLGSDINGKAQLNYLGWSVCISDDGKMIAAGAIGNEDNGGSSGHVRVYSYNATSNLWVQVGSDLNGEASLDQLGWSVDMSADGKTIAIGAIGNDNTNGNDSGHARVYTINASLGNWIQVGADIDGEATGDQSGYSVAISSDGNTVAVGAPSYDNANDVDAGHVRVFSNNSTSKNWTQVGSDINGKATKVSFGRSVAISSDGKTIAIGAPLNNNINSNVAGNVAGYVRVYTINGTSSNWTQVGLDINGVALNDQSGYSVAMSADGKTIAIGAVNNDNIGGMNSGHVRVFCINSTSGNWTQVGSDIIGEGEGDNAGHSVAISNDGFTLVIGALFNNNINVQSGNVRVYKYELPPTKAPTRMPTKAPTKPPTKTPTKTPTRRPTKAPSNSLSKFPTRRPTNDPTKSPTNVPTKRPTKNPTKAPSQVILPVPIPIMVPIQVPLTSPVSVPTNCGLFNLNFFCPRRGECGFWRRLLNLRGC